MTDEEIDRELTALFWRAAGLAIVMILLAITAIAALPILLVCEECSRRISLRAGQLASQQRAVTARVLFLKRISQQQLLDAERRNPWA